MQGQTLMTTTYVRDRQTTAHELQRNRGFLMHGRCGSSRENRQVEVTGIEPLASAL